MKIEYCGPHLIAEIDDLERDYYQDNIRSGEPIEVPDSVGANLLEQETWRKPVATPLALPAATPPIAPAPAAATTDTKGN